MKSRILIVFMFLVLTWIGLLAKAFYLQVLPNKRLSQLQKKQFERMLTLQPRRGAIVDRNGKELAVSIPSYSLFADPSLIKNPKTLAYKLSLQLGLHPPRLQRKLSKNERRFVWVKRQMEKSEIDKILKWKIPGLGFIEEPKRIYPSNHLLSQVVGFVGREGRGLEGLELYFDELLNGKAEQLKMRRDARGRPLLINGQVFSEYPDGQNLQLTIDSNVQFFLEKELQHSVETYDADSAVGVVLDSKSGEILAMANAPLYNPNRPMEASGSLRKNRVLLDAYEPGSTFKTFAVAAALAANKAQPNTRYFCENGKFKIGNRVITEADETHSFGWLTVSEILAQSSNIGTTKLVMEVGESKFRNILSEFGFGEKLHVDFGSESKGILQPLPWNKHLLSNVSFGHGISATPLQMTMAYNVIANGGWLVKPILVKRAYKDLSEEEKVFESQKIRKVLDEKVAATMRLMLMSATAKKSTGYAARIKGFPVGGKTGTAQKVDHINGGYIKESYISSFAGFVPANDPKFVIYIAVDNPRDEYYGSKVAAPIFSKVASFLVRQEGLEPTLLSQSDIHSETQKSQDMKLITPSFLVWDEETIPDLRGLTLREVFSNLRGKGYELDIRGSGRVSEVWPEPGELLPKNKKLRLELSTQ